MPVKKVVAANSQLSILNSELKKLNNSQHEANERLLHTNQTLTEANHIKEEYLGRFLSLSSSYISKMEEYRRILNKQLLPVNLRSYIYIEVRPFHKSRVERVLSQFRCIFS